MVTTERINDMANLEQASTISQNVATNLLPDSIGISTSGPSTFAQGNTRVVENARAVSNERAAALIGFPEADLSKQTGRYHFVNSVQWSITSKEGDKLFEIDTETFLKNAGSFRMNSQFYRNIRANPILRLSISGNSAHVGMFVVIFQPVGVIDKCVDYRQPGPFSSVFCYPTKNSAVELPGNFVKNVRYDDTSKTKMNFGKFVGFVVNPLRVPPNTPSTVTIETAIRFENISFRVYKSPKADSDFLNNSTLSLLHREYGTDYILNLLKKLEKDKSVLDRIPEVDEKKGFLETANDVVDFFDKIGNTITNYLPLGAMLFHAPQQRTTDEWCVTDRPKPSQRVQFLDESICVPDPSVTQLPMANDLADFRSMNSWKWLIDTFEWSNTKSANEVLYSKVFKLTSMPDTSYYKLAPPFVRATQQIQIQAIKNVFHKGQLVVQVLSGDEDTSKPTDRDTISHVFDISDTDTMHFDIPWPYHTDFQAADSTNWIKIQIGVVCQLQSVNTTSSIQVNVWRSLAPDQIWIGSPDQHHVDTRYISVMPKELDEKKGDSQNNIKGDQMAQFVSDEVTEQDEHSNQEVPQAAAVELKDQLVTEAEATDPLFSTTANDSMAWTCRNTTSLKLAAHRYIGFYDVAEGLVPSKVDTPIKLKAGMNDQIIFSGTQTDLLRCLPQSVRFAYVSGGIRIKLVFQVGNMLGGTFKVMTLLEGLGYGDQGRQYFRKNVVDNKEFNFSVPYVQKYPCVPTRHGSVETKGCHEVQRNIVIMMSTNSEKEWNDAKVYIYIAAEDDIFFQQPLPGFTVSKAPVVLSKQIVYGDKKFPPDPKSASANLNDSLDRLSDVPHFLKDLPQPNNGLQGIDNSNSFGRLQGLSDPNFRRQSRALKTEEIQYKKGDGYRDGVVRKITFECCSTRKQYVLSEDNTSFDRRHNAKKIDFELIQEEESSYIHAHTRYACIKCVYGDFVSAYDYICSIQKDIDEHAFGHFVKVKPVFTHKKVSFDTRVATRTPEGYYEVLGSSNGTLLRTYVLKTVEQKFCWGDLDEKKGIFDKAYDKMADSVGEIFKEKLGDAMFETLNQKTKGILAVKAAAYITHLLSCDSPLSLASFFLSVCGDLYLFLDMGEWFKKFLEFFRDNAMNFINFFYTVGDGPDDTFHDEKKGDKLEIDEIKTEIKIVTLPVMILNFIADCCKFVYNYVPSADKIRNFFKDLGLVGMATRGVKSVIDAFVGILRFMGFMGGEKEAKLRKVEALMQHPEFAEDTYNIRLRIDKPLSYTSEGLKEIQRLRERAHMFVASSVGVSDPQVSEIREHFKKFLSQTETVARDRRGVTDFEPVFIVLEGQAGTGKSVLANFIAKSITTALGRAEDDYYTVNLDQTYWTGYVDQPVAIIDDFGQDPEGKGAAFLTQLISSVATPLQQAAIEDKSNISSLRFVIVTTNNHKVPTHWFVDSSAYYRRISLAFTPERSRDGSLVSQIKGWTCYNWRKSDTSTDYEQHVLASTITQEEVVKKVWNFYRAKWDLHLEMKKVRCLQLDTDSKYQATAEKPPYLEHTCPKILTDNDVTITAPGDLTLEEVLQCKVDWTQYDLILYNMAMDSQSFQWKNEKVMCNVKDQEKLKLTCSAFDMACMVNNDPKSVRKALIGKPRSYVAKTIQFYNNNLILHEDLKKMLPRQNIWTRWIPAAKEAIKRKKKHLGILAGIIGGLASSYAVYKLWQYASSDEQKGTYAARARANIAQRMSALGGALQTKKGDTDSEHLHNKVKIIKQYSGKWTCHDGEKNICTVTALSIGQGYLLVPKHAIRVGMTHYFRLNKTGVEYTVPVSYDNMSSYIDGVDGIVEKSLDYALIFTGNSVPFTRDLTNFFAGHNVISNMPNTPIRVPIIINGEFTTEIDTHQEYDKSIPVYWNGSVHITEGFRIPIKVENGTCGSVAFVTQKGFDFRIIGLVVSGSSTLTTLAPISKEIIGNLQGAIKIACKLPEIPIDTWTVDKIEVCQPKCAGPGPVNVKIKPLGDGVIVNTSTAYTRGVDREYVYSVLADEEKREPSMRAIPYMGDPKKLPTRTADLEVSRITSDPSMDKLAVKALIMKLSENIPVCRNLTEHETLNGRQFSLKDGRVVIGNDIPRNTAIGYTTIKAGFRGKKGDLMEAELVEVEGKFGIKTLETVRCWRKDFKDHLNSFEAKILQGVEPDRVITIFLKDELRPEEKIYQGKIRAIYSEDIAMIALLTKYFGQFMDYYRGLHFSEAYHTLGEDPVMIWDALGKFITYMDKGQGRTVCSGDAKNWDLSVRGYMFDHVRDVIDWFYDNNMEIPIEDRMFNKQMRLKLLDMVCFSVTCYGRDYFLSDGMKSGIYCTTEFNSLIQTVIILSICIEHLHTRKDTSLDQDIKDALLHRFTTNGDDNLNSEPPDCFQITSKEFAQKLLEGYKKHGITLTSSTKTGPPEFMHITEIDYLRRSFHLFGGHFYPHINLGTIAGLLTFYRRSTTLRENFLEALAFCHQACCFDTFETVRFLYLAQFEKEAPTWNDVAKTYPRPDHALEVQFPLDFWSSHKAFDFSPYILSRFFLTRAGMDKKTQYLYRVRSFVGQTGTKYGPMRVHSRYSMDFLLNGYDALRGKNFFHVLVVICLWFVRGAHNEDFDHCVEHITDLSLLECVLLINKVFHPGTGFNFLGRYFDEACSRTEIEAEKIFYSFLMDIFDTAEVFDEFHQVNNFFVPTSFEDLTVLDAMTSLGESTNFEVGSFEIEYIFDPFAYDIDYNTVVSNTDYRYGPDVLNGFRFENPPEHIIVGTVIISYNLSRVPP